MRSSRQGASFRTILKEDLDAFPFPDPAQFGAIQQSRVLELTHLLETSEDKPWQEIDDFVFHLYNLDKHDATVVRDTVAFSGPYRTVREQAEQPPPPNEVESFRQYLEDMLQSLFRITGQTVKVAVESLGETQWNQPWRFLSISLNGENFSFIDKLLPKLMVDANNTGASRIALRVPHGGLVLGLLNQRGFWTRTRARLCSLYIEENHLDSFPIPAL